MIGEDQTGKSNDRSDSNEQPSVKVYSPRLEEFEEAVKSARTRFQELPDWLRNNVRNKLHDK